MEIKDCEQAKSGECCYCKNMAYEQIRLDYLGTKDELTLTRIELEKQKYRLEERIRKLEQENEAFKQSEQEGLEIIAELKAENKKLKYDKELYEDLNRQKRLVAQQLIKDNTELIKENEELQGYYQNEHCDVLRLTKCLDEIYEICDKELCKGEIKDLDMYCAIESIIHKVKEVKGNE